MKITLFIELSSVRVVCVLGCVWKREDRTAWCLLYNAFKDFYFLFFSFVKVTLGQMQTDVACWKESHFLHSKICCFFYRPYSCIIHLMPDHDGYYPSCICSILLLFIVAYWPKKAQSQMWSQNTSSFPHGCFNACTVRGSFRMENYSLIIWNVYN